MRCRQKELWPFERGSIEPKQKKKGRSIKKKAFPYILLRGLQTQMVHTEGHNTFITTNYNELKFGIYAFVSSCLRDMTHHLLLIMIHRSITINLRTTAGKTVEFQWQ